MSDMIYILGSGRSGSTVIERVLATASRVIATGELHALWRLPLADLVCACGMPVALCDFWSEVLSSAGITPNVLTRLAWLEHRVVRHRHLVRLRYDPARIRSDPAIAEFLSLQHQLFTAIRDTGSGEVILDSSKAGPRAFILAAGCDVQLLHLHRAAGDVIASWRRPKVDPATGALMRRPGLGGAMTEWIKAQHAARMLNAWPRSSRIDYADFAMAPRPTLQDALSTVFPGLVDTIQWRDDRTVAAPTVYHSILGNPDRFSRDDIVIRPRHATERAALSRREALVLRAIDRTLGRLYP